MTIKKLKQYRRNHKTKYRLILTINEIQREITITKHFKGKKKKRP